MGNVTPASAERPVSPRPRAEGAGHRLAAWLWARRALVLGASFAVAIGCALLASRLQLKSDFSNLLPPSAESVKQLHRLETRTYVPSTFMLGIESADPSVRARAAASLRSRLDALPRDLVDEASYDDAAALRFAWNNRFLFASIEDLEAARHAIELKIQRENPLFVSLEDEDATASEQHSIDALRRKLDDARKNAEAPAVRVSADQRLQLVLLRASFSSDDTARARRLVELLDRALAEVRAEVGPAVSLGMTGDAITSLAENRTLIEGMLFSTLVTVVLVIGALLLYYRTVLGVGALAWSLAVGALATFGFAKIAIGHLNLASAFLSSIVIGNGINFGILLLARYLEERRAGAAGVDAIGAAMVGTAPGTFAAAAAAAAAYGSLVITPFRGFRHFGLIGGVGMLLCWITTYTLFPAALAIVDRRIRVGREPAIARAVGALLPREGAWRVATAGLLLLAVVAAASARYLTHDPLETNLRNLRSYTRALDEASAWMDKFDHAFGHGISGGFVIAAPTRQDASRVADRLRAVDAGKLERERLLSRIATIDDLLPSDQGGKIDLLGEIRRLLDGLLPRVSDQERRELLELRPPDDLRPVADADIPRELAWPFTERDGTRGRLVVANTGLGVDMWNTNHVERFAQTVRGLGLGPDVVIGGSAFVFADMLDAMERDGPRATLLAALGALAIVLFTVSFSRFAAVTIACGALGTLSLLAVASVIGLKVNFLDFVALPITIGIGIDYSVNIASRARQAGSLARTALASTGGAVLLCSYTTVVGYASLLFSSNRGIRSFGLSAMIGELTCITTALLFAPALLQTIERRTAARNVTT